MDSLAKLWNSFAGISTTYVAWRCPRAEKVIQLAVLNFTTVSFSGFGSARQINRKQPCEEEGSLRCNQKTSEALTPGRIVTVTRAAKGFEVTRSPFGSFPTATTLMVRWPNGGPYLNEVEM